MGNALSNDEINKRLHEAAEKGDIKQLQKYVKKGGDLNRQIEIEHIQKPQCIKPEFQSERGGLGSSVNSLAADSPAERRSSIATSTTTARELKMNALHRAASRKNNIKALQYVLSRISDVDEQDSHGDSALHYVSMFHNNDRTLAILLNFRPNINLQNDRGETPLFSAVITGCDIKVIEWLLKSGANPDMCNIDGDTPLHVCAMRRGIDPLIPGILLRFGANPNLKNRLGQTPLHVAAETSNNAVLLLLKFNAKVRLRDHNGHRPSDVAATEDIRLLLQGEEHDLLERTVQMSDIVASEDTLLACSPSMRSSTSVQNWLNTQRSINGHIEIDVTDSASNVKQDNPRVIYPRRTKLSGSGRRLSRGDSYLQKFAGGGGNGIIHLPGNKEIIIPPDAMPLGTSMQITIDSTDEENNIPDLSQCNIKLDLSIALPGNATDEVQQDILTPPVFTGMCLEGETKWSSTRDVQMNPNAETCVKFAIMKEKAIALTKRDNRAQRRPHLMPKWRQARYWIVRWKYNPEFLDHVNHEDSYQKPPSIRITAPIQPNAADYHALTDSSSSTSDDDTSTASPQNADENHLSAEKFCSRQIKVYKETSETSGSCDTSDIDSFTDEDYRNDVDNAELKHNELLDAAQENARIQHPIDLELATIAEELSEDPSKRPNVKHSPLDNDVFNNNRHQKKSTGMYSPNQTPKRTDSTLSVDSGYKEPVDLKEE